MSYNYSEEEITAVREALTKTLREAGRLGPDEQATVTDDLLRRIFVEARKEADEDLEAAMAVYSAAMARYADAAAAFAEEWGAHETRAAIYQAKLDMWAAKPASERGSFGEGPPPTPPREPVIPRRPTPLSDADAVARKISAIGGR